jgi:DNA-directed RNA polymerase specialized sigma24 family protein
MQQDEEYQAPATSAQFRTTRWSVVLRAGAEQLSPTLERQALEELCRTYWYPLYSFIRRKGHAPEVAEDLTQGFFLQLLARNSFVLASEERGRFRTFLLCALNHYLTNQWQMTQRQKRGSGVLMLSLDVALAESRFGQEPVTTDSPERVFDRRWVEVLLGNVLARLRSEAEADGEVARFDRLKSFLVEDQGDETFQEIATSLGSTEAAV